MLPLTKEQISQFALAVVTSEMLDKHNALAIATKFCEHVLPAVTVVPINPPGGETVGFHLFEGGAKSFLPDPQGLRPAVEFLRGGQAQAETKAPVIMAMVGEDHYHGLDKMRTGVLWRTFNDVTRGERLVVLERGMNKVSFYGYEVSHSSQPIVTEEEMMGDMPHAALASEKCRSVIMAAFVFLCVASGRQDRRSKLLLPIGQNHMEDFLVAFEYFVMSSNTITWVRKRARAYYTMTSLKG